ncbi:hypothetical protein RGE_18130 [Rubrivivax gelatinosus IL144]|uniref:Uncharacterized protein n=1 Tax=Rubrivivax gelatinosus (strain NBRC 100245 / IL144) TaxID=983917 RepID=I0HQ67_RUBGI|nr:hypothetical protein RGE_18130 [Rubrivivax gelatinosus IL144]
MTAALQSSAAAQAHRTEGPESGVLRTSPVPSRRMFPNDRFPTA